MVTYTLNFGQKQLARVEELVFYVVKLIKDKRRTGQPLSRIFRQIFENKKTRRIFGLNLTLVALFTGILIPPISAFSGNPQAEITTINPEIIQLTTESSVRVPTDSFVVSQGYSLFHRGIDLDGQTGEPVYPVMDGVVEQTISGRFGFGNHIIINHGSGFKSLYAHLSKIVVKENEKVDKGTVIGTIGSTGMAFGDHLHLEVYDNDRTFNPLTILK